MTIRKTFPSLTALAAATLSTAAAAVPVPIDTTSAQNGVTEIYSVTFDGPVAPCGASSPSYCAFFQNGFPPPSPPAVRALAISPNPTTVVNGIPDGITPVPAAGSYLDLTLGAGNASVTLAGGTITIPNLTVVIRGETVVHTSNAGIVFNAAPQTVPVDANGVAELFVNLAPAVAADFSNFTSVITSCSGSLCSVIPLLTLDMVRYRLLIDYDATFTIFTASFTGQTQNNSFLFATLNSGVPNISVTDSAPPTTDQQVPFGGVTVGTIATRTVTVTNSGSGNLVLRTLGQAQALAAPFALSNDTCSGHTLTPASACTVDVTFSPPTAVDSNSSFDIPSNDIDEPSVTLTVTGTGTALPVPKIVVTDSVAPAGDLQLPFGSITEGLTSVQSVTIANDGNADLHVMQVALADPLAPFSLVNVNCSNRTVPALASCMLEIQFQPTAAGTFDDQLDIPSDDPDTPAVTVAVSGTGASLAVPAITITDDVSPTNDQQVAYRNVFVSATADHTITVTNDGTGNLVMGTAGSTNPLAAPFTFVADDCSDQTIPPAGNCTITVRFAPDAVDAYSDAFDIPSNDPDEGTTASVLVNGSGGIPEEEPSPEGASPGFMALDPLTLLALGLSGVVVYRRRRPTLH